MCLEILLQNSFQKNLISKNVDTEDQLKNRINRDQGITTLYSQIVQFYEQKCEFFFVQTILYCYYYGCVLEIGSSCKVLFTLYNTTLYFYQESRRQIMGGQTCHDLAVTSYIFISRSILVLQKSSVHSDVISHNKNIHNFGYTQVCREVQSD